MKRVIPVIGYTKRKLVKTKKFKSPNYIGDPINAIKIFNDKEVDEIIVLDIRASKLNYGIDYQLIEQFASECFMPLAYGGGVNSFYDAERIFKLGVEKVILNSILNTNPLLIKQIANSYGNQSVICSIDVKKNFFGKYQVYYESGTKKSKKPLNEILEEIQNLGAGEIMISNIERDGTFLGYDRNLLELIKEKINTPLILNSGAGTKNDFSFALKNGADAVAASSAFVYKNQNPNSILINYFK